MSTERELAEHGIEIKHIQADVDTIMEDMDQLKKIYDAEFPNYRNHIIDSVGHTDGIFCIVCPGLIVAHDDPNCVIDYDTYFPDWEVIYVKNTNAMAAQQKKYKEFFKKTKSKNVQLLHHDRAIRGRHHRVLRQARPLPHVLPQALQAPI